MSNIKFKTTHDDVINNIIMFDKSMKVLWDKFHDKPIELDTHSTRLTMTAMPNIARQIQDFRPLTKPIDIIPTILKILHDSQTDDDIRIRMNLWFTEL